MPPGAEGLERSSCHQEKLGQILKRMKVVSEKDIQEALTIQRHSKRKIGEILVEMNRISLDEVEIARSFQDGAVVVKEEEIDPNAPELPESP